MDRGSIVTLKILNKTNKKTQKIDPSILFLLFVNYNVLENLIPKQIEQIMSV